MLRNKLVRSDGRIIDSSVIVSCEFTEEVNSGENLSVGDVTSSEINVELLSTDMVEQGEVLTYYIIEDGVETLIGVFNAEKPTVASRTSIKFSAYDNIVKSEKLFSDWLRSNQNLFPMTLGELVVHACNHCGLTLASQTFYQHEIEINAFYGDGITCRQILSWAGAIAGQFVRANSSGGIEFAWYVDATNLIVAPNAASATNSISVTDDGEGNVNVVGETATVSDDGDGNVSVEIPSYKTVYNNGVVLLAKEVTTPYKQGSLSYEGYATDVIKRVQIKFADNDVGVIYPATATGNCFIISENALLATCSTETVTFVAKSLYDQLSAISYVPAKMTLPRTIVIRAGNIITIRDPNGAVLTTYVMKVSVTSSGTSVESTGDKTYDSNVAVASEKYTNLTGKMLRVDQSVDGLKVVASDLDGRTSSLEQTAAGLTTRVGNAEGDITTLEQTAAGLTTRVETSEGNYSDLRQDVDGIGSRVGTAEGNYSTLKQNVDEIEGRVEDAKGNYTALKQSVDGFTLTFQTIDDEIKAVDADLQSKYNERVSYIRFEDGNIILGKTDSEIMLVQKNNRISFVRNVAGLPEVAWFSDNVLHVTEGQFTVQLGIGNFGFRPGANGNLSFKKVVS